MMIYQSIIEDLFLFAGPCVIEDKNVVLKTAEELKKITDELNIPFVFKSSFDKANRTSIDSYRGPGLEEGLKILDQVKKDLDVPLVIDVHKESEVTSVAEVADILQIPAFLCRQTDLILSAGKSRKPVNVKKGQFLSPESVKFIFEKLESVDCREIFITERGNTFGYGRLVVDFTGFPVMKQFGYPVIFDATHSVQLPSTGDSKTGGLCKMIPSLLNAAVAAGINGIFMEIHPDPDKALSDKGSQFPLSGIKEVLKQAKEIYQVVNR